MWTPCTQLISWKYFEMDEVGAAFEESSIPLAITRAYYGQEEVNDTILSNLRGVSAIVHAKAQASGSVSYKQPTCRASLIIGEGQERFSRKFELIWWPDLFSQQERGKVFFAFLRGENNIKQLLALSH